MQAVAIFAILKLAGPTLGYALGSLCLRYYEDPRMAPVLERTDPRWVGAWWLGYVVLGACLAVTALPILFFPRHLSPQPAAQRSGTDSSTKVPTKKGDEAETKVGFWCSVRSLFRNPAYVFRLVYWLLASNANLGHAMMSSKYVEVQFRTSASQASFLIGPVLMITNVLGLGVGGLALHAFRPRPRLVTLYTTLCDVLRLACLVACAFIGCEAVRLAGTVTTVAGHGSSIQLACSDSCNCTTRHFQPLCDPVNRTVFFSPCHAGCTKFSATDSGEVSFDECSCLPNLPSQLQRGQQKEQLVQADQGAPYLGLCSGDTCSNVLAFIALSSLVGFIARTTTVGHTIVGLRCVSREEKAMALGVQEGLSSIFTYIPYPILYGAIFDSSCLVWEDKCGRPGVCWIYDADRLRYTYHGLSVAILLSAILFEVGLVYHSGRLADFYSDTTTKASQKDKLITAEAAAGDSEAVCLVDGSATERPAGCEKTEDGGGQEDEDLLNGEDHHATCGCCARDSKDQTSIC
ncbi:hypothetical protein V5799_008508 [Amblyomma americanum]|uniref:Solute carrier organic anion transporter family member n=1 Tax=Amblyomma americanum TaxID=6943 RepID=A0AAQ4FEQ7_AMBAM